MGVLGLTTFIDKNTHLFRKHELRNCSVVIDGNNLYYHVYKGCGVEARFGGDYDVYRQQLRINFKSLLKCDVMPYVVLDGGYTPDNKKKKKCLERAQQRLLNAHIAQVKGECRMVPLLAYDTFIQTLEELGIPHVTCQFEADCEVAKLANKLKCPVISNDSDFFIFDLAHGFLPLDYLDFNPLYKRNIDGSKSSPFLHCQMYNVESFLDSFGLNRSMLPVLATLLGNDYTPPMAFQKVDKSIQLPLKQRVHISPKVSKVMKLIHWLTLRCDDPDNVLDIIKPYIQGQKKFFTSVEGYVDIHEFEGCDLFSYFSRNKEAFVPAAAPNFVGYNGSAFPDWFLLAICKGQITPAVINAAVIHRIIFSAQVEDLTSPTIHQCSEHIRRIIYGILMTSDPVSKRERRNVSVEEDKVGTGLSDVLQCVIAKMGTDMSDEDQVEMTMSGEGDGSIQIIEGEREKSMVLETDHIEMEQLQKYKSHHSQDPYENVECESGEEKEDVEIISDDENDETMPSVPRLKKQTFFEEYHRENRHLKKFYLSPVLSVAGNKLPSLTALGDLDRDKRLSLLLGCLEVDAGFINRFSTDLQMFMLGVIIWIRNANPAITQLHLDCAILCPILLHMLNPPNSCHGKSQGKSPSMNKDEEKDSSHECIDIEVTCHHAKLANKDKFYMVRDNLNRYRTMKFVCNWKKGVLLECQNIHGFAQLQSCLFEISNLNKILRFPLPALQPGFFFNGSFLYNFYDDLMSRALASNFLEAMLLKGSDLHNAFLAIQWIVLEAVGGDSFFIAPSGKGIKKRRKKKKGKGKKPLCEESELEMAEDKNSGESEEDVTTIQGFDVQNKFSLLTL